MLAPDFKPPSRVESNHRDPGPPGWQHEPEDRHLNQGAARPDRYRRPFCVVFGHALAKPHIAAAFRKQHRYRGRGGWRESHVLQAFFDLDVFLTEQACFTLRFPRRRDYGAV